MQVLHIILLSTSIHRTDIFISEGDKHMTANKSREELLEPLIEVASTLERCAGNREFCKHSYLRIHANLRLRVCLLTCMQSSVYDFLLTLAYFCWMVNERCKLKFGWNGYLQHMPHWNVLYMWVYIYRNISMCIWNGKSLVKRFSFAHFILSHACILPKSSHSSSNRSICELFLGWHSPHCHCASEISVVCISVVKQNQPCITVCTWNSVWSCGECWLSCKLEYA